MLQLAHELRGEMSDRAYGVLQSIVARNGQAALQELTQDLDYPYYWMTTFRDHDTNRRGSNQRRPKAED
jgi:hypothetical protein